MYSLVLNPHKKTMPYTYRHNQPVNSMPYYYFMMRYTCLVHFYYCSMTVLSTIMNNLDSYLLGTFSLIARIKQGNVASLVAHNYTCF